MAKKTKIKVSDLNRPIVVDHEKNGFAVLKESKRFLVRTPTDQFMMHFSKATLEVHVSLPSGQVEKFCFYRTSRGTDVLDSRDNKKMYDYQAKEYLTRLLGPARASSAWMRFCLAAC